MRIFARAILYLATAAMLATSGCVDAEPSLTVNTRDGSRFYYADTPEARAAIEAAIRDHSEWVVLPYPSTHAPCRVQMAHIVSIAASK